MWGASGGGRLLFVGGESVMRPDLDRLSKCAVLAAAASALAGGPVAAAAPQGDTWVAPVCQRASHERLIIRDGRDVCGASLNRAGQPMAMGYLPTACPRETDDYRIDAAGRVDRCFRRPGQGERS
jgi:hypothetical protein